MFLYLGLKWCFVAFVWLLAAVSSLFFAFQQKICEDSLNFFAILEISNKFLFKEERQCKYFTIFLVNFRSILMERVKN